ncbi:MAG: hypothetical protein ACRCYW_02385, partial [Aeromonas sp.]|uniref:hypothetical protein n=1 Tax=Aeromonas sp. TaxID=647 RepID=UPI003F3C660A
MAPLARLGEGGPVPEATVTKEFVKFLIGEAFVSRPRVGDIIGRDVAGGGVDESVGKGGKVVSTTRGTEGKAKARRGGGQVAGESQGIITNKRGGAEIWDAASGSRGTEKDNVLGIINGDMEGRIRQSNFLIGSKEVGIGVKAAVHTDRFEPHGKARDVVPARLLNDVITKRETDSAFA